MRRKLRTAEVEGAKAIIASIGAEAHPGRAAFVKLLMLRNPDEDVKSLLLPSAYENKEQVVELATQLSHEAWRHGLNEAGYHYWKIYGMQGVEAHALAQLSCLGVGKALYNSASNGFIAEHNRYDYTILAADKGYHRAQLEAALLEYDAKHYASAAQYFKSYLEQNLYPLSPDVGTKVIDAFAKAGEHCNPFGCWLPDPGVHCWVDMANHYRVKTVLLAGKRKDIPRDIAFMIIRFLITK